MKSTASLSAVVLLVLAQQSVSASPNADVSASAIKQPPPAKWALGFSAQLQSRGDYGQVIRRAFVPEIIGFRYIPLRPQLFLRPGARIGFAGITQAEMPTSLSIKEYDLMVHAEVGILWDSYVVPSIALGVEQITRMSRTQTSVPIDEESRTDFELLLGAYLQAGVGVPVGATGLLVEPYLRYEVVPSDHRLHWRLGFDFTLALF